VTWSSLSLPPESSAGLVAGRQVGRAGVLRALGVDRGVAVGVRSVPDVKRYLAMRRM